MSSRLALAAVTALLQDLPANRLAEVLVAAGSSRTAPSRTAPSRTGPSRTGPEMSLDSCLAGRAGHR